MHFTKEKNIPGVAVFLDFEKAFDSIEWNFIHKCLETFNFGSDLRQWIKVFYTNISSCVLNNGHASKHFLLERGVRQGFPLSGILFVSIYTLSDLGYSSNLIGSLSRANAALFTRYRVDNALSHKTETKWPA